MTHKQESRHSHIMRQHKRMRGVAGLLRWHTDKPMTHRNDMGHDPKPLTRATRGMKVQVGVSGMGNRTLPHGHKKKSHKHLPVRLVRFKMGLNQRPPD